MHESDQPAGETDELDTTPVDDDVVVDTESAELELDELNDAFDTVDAALKALDSDDLVEAEALVASLGDPSAVTTDDAEPESSSTFPNPDRGRSSHGGRRSAPAPCHACARRHADRLDRTRRSQRRHGRPRRPPGGGPHLDQGPSAAR